MFGTDAVAKLEGPGGSLWLLTLHGHLVQVRMAGGEARETWTCPRVARSLSDVWAVVWFAPIVLNVWGGVLGSLSAWGLGTSLR